MLKLRYLLEFSILFIFTKIFRLFSVELSSNIAGFLGRNLGYFIGRFTGDNKKAFKHLEFAFPNLMAKKKKKIIQDSYENIGRFIAEYINQHKMNINYFKKNVEIINESIFMEHMINGCFPMTAHFGNWEILQRYSLLMNVSLNVIYNPLKNPYTNKLYLSQREVPQLPKGTNAMKQLIELIKKKKNVGVLVDQRDKLGEIFPFFNQEARTSTAIQRLCIKYNYKILPVKCERRKDNPNKFIITTFPPLEIEKSGNIEEDVKSLTNKTLEITESWIKQNPSHWMLWSYARWRTKF